MGGGGGRGGVWSLGFGVWGIELDPLGLGIRLSVVIPGCIDSWGPWRVGAGRGGSPRMG